MKKVTNTPYQRRCARCKEIKCLDQFAKVSQFDVKPYGRQYHCKLCARRRYWNKKWGFTIPMKIPTELLPLFLFDKPAHRQDGGTG